MRRILAAALCLSVAACAGIEPGEPPLAGANELRAGPGLFSGSSGEFLLIGTDPLSEPEKKSR